ncbi:unnamed protein product [Prunus armeniaca]
MKRLNLAECDRIIDFGVMFLEKMCCWACLSRGEAGFVGVAGARGLRCGWVCRGAGFMSCRDAGFVDCRVAGLGSKSGFANIRAEEMVMGCSAAIVVSLLE